MPSFIKVLHFKMCYICTQRHKHAYRHTKTLSRS